MKSGDTADVQCAELAIKYEQWVRKQQEEGKDTSHNHSQEDLQAMVQRVKEQRNANKAKDQ